MSDALLTFSIGPVHTFIGQARRIADLWAGSQILSDLMGATIKSLLENDAARLIFPKVTRDRIPLGLPNRFVARVPLTAANEVAIGLESEIRSRWAEIVKHGAAQLRRLQLDVDLDRHPWEDAIECAWSWVRDEGDYQAASRAGSQLFAASRVYRPFAQTYEAGMKCAICGERNALPDGDRNRVTAAWQRAEKHADGKVKELTPFVRGDQTRLCLVCAAKRFYPTLERMKDRRTIFESFEAFQPSDADKGKRDRNRPYFALVTMDGDRLGQALRNSSEQRQGEISEALSAFAESLRTHDSADLNLQTIGLPWPPPGASDPKRRRPQLIYAGGEDVLFVSDPRDALGCAMAIRKHYGKCFENRKLDRAKHTISAAIIFAHTKIPAGRLLHEAEGVLKRKAKATRDAVAIALHKRSGTPVETAFPWEGVVPVGLLSDIVAELQAKRLASGQMYSISDDQRALTGVLTSQEEWSAWLEWRLSRGEVSRKDVARLASLLAPLFAGGEPRIEALRIARFLAIEAAPRRRRDIAVEAGGAA